jgi:diacylglycerol O-acyltransferase
MSTSERMQGPLQLDPRMTPGDALFWFSEAAVPHLRLHVAALFMLDRAPDPARFRAATERLVAMVPRFRQRVVADVVPFELPRWEEDPAFDLDYHLREIRLPGSPGEDDLFAFVGPEIATPLDRDRPLWEGYLIPELADGRAAYLLKLHHSMMDGVGSVAMFEALTQGSRTEPIHVPRTAAARHAPASARQQALSAAGDGVQAVAGLVRRALRVARTAMTDPVAAAAGSVRAAAGVAEMLRELGGPGGDPLCDRATGVGRRVSGLTLSLPRLLALKDALGATLNDVALTVVSGAVGRYYDEHHMRTEEVACVVPVNVRDEKERYALGNRVGTIVVQLPVGEKDPLIRLERIRSQTARAKTDRTASTFQFVVNAAALVPAPLIRLAAEAGRGRYQLVCTNVPGPRTTRYIGGARMDTVYPFAPVFLGIPIAVALFSVGDTYAVGVASDPAAVPDPATIRNFIAQVVDDLERRVSRRSTHRQRKPRRPTRSRSRRAATASAAEDAPLPEDAAQLHEEPA